MRLVTGLMIERISEFRGVSPHQRRNFLLPERSMITPQQNRKVFLQAERYARTDHRQSGHIGARTRKRIVENIIRIAIAEQTEKVARVGDTHGQAGRDSLGFVQIGSKANHFEYMPAFDFDFRLLIQPADEITAAEQIVFFAIERDEAYRGSR